MYLFRNILRIVALLSCLCLVFFFLLDGCGGMSGNDEENLRNRDSGRGRDDRGRGRDGGENDVGDRDEDNKGSFRDRFGRRDPSSSKEVEADSEEITENPVVDPSNDQNPVSDKIDFLFIMDTSGSNEDYIETSVIQRKLGSFIRKLNEENIDWRIFTTCGHTDKDEPLYNGRLHELEHNGSLIKFLYLDNHILDAYRAKDPLALTSQVFIDTISHTKRRDCDKPPFCYRDKENRPLKAFSGFLKTASKHNILREDADFIVIIISNQDERPSQTKPKIPYDARDIQDQLKRDFSDKTWHAISFVVRSIDTNCTDGKVSTDIPNLAMLTDGLVASICSNNYTQTIIDLIREKQGKEVTSRPSSSPTSRAQSPENLRSNIYGNSLKRR